MGTTIDYMELCRLCLEKEQVSVPIFEDDGDVRQIFLKIHACLPVKVSREDKLPKKICDDCVYKVELCYQFWNTTANAEKQLLELLGEVEGLEDKQGYVTEVLDSNVMGNDQTSNDRLEGSVLHVGDQTTMDISMVDNMTIMTIPAGSEQQFTSVPMNTSDTVQTVAGPSTQIHDQIAQSQSHIVDEVEESEDDGCDNEGLAVKEEHEEDHSDQTFVSLPCDEAGPSGLQQQKMEEITDIALQPTVDPKTGIKRSRARLPAILQRKRQAESDKEHTNAEESPTVIVASESSIESVLKSLDRIIVLKPLTKSTLEKSPTITIMSSEETVSLPESEPQDDMQNEQYEEVEESIDYMPQSTFDCDSCDESFSDRSSLIIHKTEKSIVRTRAALREPMVQFTCDICKRVFVNKSVFVRHYKNCGVVELESLPPNYRKRRPRTSAPKRNKENESVEEGPAACKKCNKVFKKEKYLKVHMATAHGEHIQCQVCYAKFDSMQMLKEHMDDKHSGDFCELCPICGKGFFLRQSLKVHMTAHARDNKPVICNICQKSFRHEVYLKKHVQQVHVELKGRKKYHCEECGYESHYKTCFRDHMYKHTGEDLVDCQVCGKNMRRGYLKIHSRIHTGEKPEICEYCGKCFSARKYLSKHRITHTGEKPYQCEICSKRYTQRGTLTLHFKKHHPGEQNPARKHQGSRKKIRPPASVEQVVEEQLEADAQTTHDVAVVHIVKDEEGAIDESNDDEVIKLDLLEEGDHVVNKDEQMVEEGQLLEEDLEHEEEVVVIQEIPIT